MKKVYLPYSGITIQMFTSKSYICENFDYDTIRIQRKISASFPGQIVMDVSKFISKDKSGGYSVYFNSRIVLIEHTLRVLTLVWSMNMDHLHNILFTTLNKH